MKAIQHVNLNLNNTVINSEKNKNKNLKDLTKEDRSKQDLLANKIDRSLSKEEHESGNTKNGSK